MRNIIQTTLISALCTLLITTTGFSEIIADHTCIDITQIPESAILQAKAELHIAYGHTSHGSQITYGMTDLVAFANNGGLGLSLPTDIFAWNNGGTNGALDLQESLDGDVGYYPQWVTNTIDFLSNPLNSHVNVIIWSWCGQAASRTEQSMIDTYLEPMTQLESDYPLVTFVYMTGHLDGTGETGNLNHRNEQIRQYCRDNNKVLFDFADIESYDPDGLTNYMILNGNDACSYDSDDNGSRETNWATDWRNQNIEDVDWYSCTSAHSDPLNANMKAYAAWWLWAKLGGWKDVCNYHLLGDLNDDCTVNLNDFALLANNWLIDCTETPDNPACLAKDMD